VSKNLQDKVEGIEEIDIKKCVVADNALNELIRKEYERAINKEKFKGELLALISKLE
jgi:hypothetical protein